MNESNASSNVCPECGGRLVFAADGRTRQCERCSHKINVVRQRETPQELMQLQQFSPEETGFANVRTAGVRELLRQGGHYYRLYTQQFRNERELELEKEMEQPLAEEAV